MTDIEEHLFREFTKMFNTAADEGFAKSVDPDDDFRAAIRHNNAVFAAFKTHRLQNDMAARLLDENGDLKPFKQWKNDVQSIASHQCGAWLRTEYDTAVIRARQAADWKQFERERDVLPNLKWLPSTSLTPGEDHRPFWGTILPIDHPFWNQHRPGDRWNCKCDLTSTDEPPTKVPVDTDNDNPHRGLDNNPGKDAKLFSDNHPYVSHAYEGAKLAVEKAVGKAEFHEIKKEARRSLQGTTLTHPEFKDGIKISRRSIDEWTNQPHIHYAEKNRLILSIDEILREAKYLGKKDDISTKPGTKFVHIFEVEIKNDKSWILIKEYQDGNTILYSISDSPNVLIGLKEK